MIKVRIHLDGNDAGYLTYTCNETMEQYLDWMQDGAKMLALTEIDTNAVISIPFTRYVVEVWEPADE